MATAKPTELGKVETGGIAVDMDRKEARTPADTAQEKAAAENVPVAMAEAAKAEGIPGREAEFAAKKEARDAAMADTKARQDAQAGHAAPSAEAA